MAQDRTWTITQSDVSRTFTISPGVGPIGPAGPAGPNNITTATETDITGILKGDGANVSAAVEDTDYQGVPAEGAFADGDKTKLDGIEAGADVTDATNVDAAGAVMESDYSPAHSVLAQQSGTGSPSAVSLGTNSLLGRASGAGSSIQGLTAAQARTLLNVEDGATADQTAAEILTAIKTVDGAGSGLDADLLDGQDSSAFATSAQGALADSAVQPGDIDTLAELNAIITDATLIDTTDSRLSDARTPTAHTHAADDLDFAGSTDIGADLADADEVMISDGGGNTTRRKSAISRLWTYIKAKIESVGLSTLEVTGDLTVDTTTLHVDSANNRVGVGTTSPGVPFHVVGGDAAFFPISGGTYNANILMDYHDRYPVMKIRAGATTVSAWGVDASASGTNFDSDGFTFRNLALSPILQITSAGDLTVDTTTLHVKSSTDRVGIGTTNPSTKLHISDAASATFRTGSGTRRIDFSSYAGDWNYAQSAGAPFVFGTADAQPLHLYTNNTKKASLSSGGNFSITSGSLTFDANSGTWNGATISGDQTMSGQVELTGQAASTDNSAMTRGLMDQRLLENIGRIFNITIADLSTSSSGTGSSATTSPSGARLNSGTATSGYGRVDLMYGTGGWTYSTPFQRPMAAALAVTFSPANVTDTNSGIRIGFGIDTAAAWDSNGLTNKGFGFEYEPDGTNHRIRAIAHDGTTYTAGSWVNIGTGSTDAGHRGLLIQSDGAGNVSVTITSAYGDTSTTYTATTTGGPTSTGPGPQSTLSAVACNESTGTPATIGVDIKACTVELK